MIVDGGRSAGPGIVIIVIEETFIGCYNKP
jgi:hypothetical protein